MFEERAAPSPFVVLWRAFFRQFFTSETVSSDDQLRQTIVWELATLLLPGLFLMIELFFDYQGIVLRALKDRQFDLLDDTLEWVALLFITYSMVTAGFIAVCVWDVLTFDTRDAAVLGPLPVRGATIVAAKVMALAGFLLAASTAVNLSNATVFAFATADRLGFAVLLRHLVAHLTATVGAATFIFAVIVVIRGAAGLLAGPRGAAIVGSLLQFIFVLALLAVVILCPAVWKIPHRALVNPETTGWLPTSWFLGLFEGLRGSRRPYFAPLAVRAVVAIAVVVAGAVVTSIAGFQREMRRALAPSASLSAGGAVRLTRKLARCLVGRDRVAVATSEFMLLTIARNRAQQTPIAINTAIGVAVVLAGLTRIQSLASLSHPRTAVLWIPLVFAYWMTIGMRAAFFVPSELAASWTFRANAPEHAIGYWSGVRASMLACVLPPTLALAGAVTIPLLGWRTAAWHAMVVLVVGTMIVEGCALTIDFVPFTRAYRPGHSKLKTRWWLYVLGLYLLAYVPARFELWAIGNLARSAPLLAALVVAVALAEIAGLRRAPRWHAQSREDPGDQPWSFTVLDIAGVTQNA